MITNCPYVLESMERANQDVMVFRFRSQTKQVVDFTSGMFAMLTYKDTSTGEQISRAYSIANAPPSDYFEFMIATIHGQMTSKLEAAKLGDIYYISAPYGQFKFDIKKCKKCLFISGGTGLAPFFSVLRYAKGIGEVIDANMLYSIKYPYEMVNKSELDSLASAGLKFTITVTRPQPGDGWTGPTGHIDAEMIKKCAPDFAERACYICGPPNFVKALKDIIIGMGVDEKKIMAEMWGA